MPGRQSRASLGHWAELTAKLGGPRFWELEGLRAPELSTFGLWPGLHQGRRQDAQLGMGPPGSG